jgi:hypothetical protein
MRAIFTGEAHAGDEDPRGLAEAHRGVRHRNTVIAAGGCDDAGLGHLAQQQVRECAARFEGARMLHQFQLEKDAQCAEPKIRAIDLDDGRTAQVGPDDAVRDGNACAIDPVAAAVALLTSGNKISAH